MRSPARALLASFVATATACGGATPPRTSTAATPGLITVPSTEVSAPPAAPVAAVRRFEVASPHGNRVDPYYWLRDDTRTSPDVLAYLNAEQAYTAAVLAPVKSVEDTLFAELRGRIKEDDASVPTFDAGYWYYRRFETGKQHPVHARRKGTMEADEEILLDGNQLATGHAFYAIGAYEVSPGGTLLAWTEDAVGRNQFTLRIKDLASGNLLADSVANISNSLVWGGDDRTLFYVGKDATTLRADRVMRHTVGAGDALLWKEDDTSFRVDVAATKSKQYAQIQIGSTTTSEVRLIDLARPAAAPRVFLPRAKDHIYWLDHLDGRFVVLTNDRGKNFRLAEVKDGKERDHRAWRDLLAHRDDTLVEGFALHRGFVGVSIRTGGLRKVRVIPAKGKPFVLDAADPTYAMAVIDTPDPAAKRLRYSYDSLTTPNTISEIEVATGKKVVLKTQPVPGFDPAQYTSEYLHATAADGTKVPISVAYKKGTPRDGTAPILVYGYGSYGISEDPEFNPNLVSLMDRGWVYAIAHIRGGQELGRAWYEDGKLLKKRNTFTDFIAASELLVAERYAARDRVFALGGSAGGLLMGAIVNLRPDLYRGVVARVPFVDVVTTMLDESIPLTTNEFDEWGNPKDKASYDYMLAYSPYDNVTAKDYPALFVQTGLWDSQVQYYEPAKWVAKLRATRTDTNPLVFDIDMSSGHGGASGRFDSLRQTARYLAFLLHVNERPDTRRGWPAPFPGGPARSAQREVEPQTSARRRHRGKGPRGSNLSM